MENLEAMARCRGREMGRGAHRHAFPIRHDVGDPAAGRPAQGRFPRSGVGQDPGRPRAAAAVETSKPAELVLVDGGRDRRPCVGRRGITPAPGFPRLTCNDGTAHRRADAILVSEEPVRGPVLVGSGSYRGHGMPRPMDVSRLVCETRC
jgi:hypothetical protein